MAEATTGSTAEPTAGAETPRRRPFLFPKSARIAARRRFGYMCLPLGKLEFTAPAENFEPLAVDDEEGEPFILRCRKDRGDDLP